MEKDRPIPRRLSLKRHGITGCRTALGAHEERELVPQ
jgi:hypothetical protein